MTQQQSNKIIIASAGGRKTTHIVEEALKQPLDKKILVTTYTIENVNQIKTYFIEQKGFIPSNIEVTTWFKFLLTHGVKPYQNHLTNNVKVKSIDFDSVPPIGLPKTNLAFYINRAKNIYRDRVSDFVNRVDEVTKGLVVDRLEKIYDLIYIDEMQDLSGWDYDFVEKLIKSSIRVTMVGDPRQTTYLTSNSLKNKGITGCNMLTWIAKLVKEGMCNFEERIECFRCNQDICDFADALYPELRKTVSKNIEKNTCGGILYYNSVEEIDSYVTTYNPAILRWDKNSHTMDYRAINIGVSKGKTFDRVLIFPTASMKQYLVAKDPSKLKQQTKSKLYVAVTRARHSVAFALDS